MASVLHPLSEKLMTEEEIKAKAFFDYTNRNCHEPKIEWEALGKPTQYLWIERMKKQIGKEQTNGHQ